jgi:hypothetical protein
MFSGIITGSFGIFMGLFAVLSKCDLRSHGVNSLPHIYFVQLLGHRLKINRSSVLINVQYR